MIAPPETMMQGRELTRRDAPAILVLGLLIAVSYFPAVLGDFIWDDAVITGAAPIRDLSGIWQIWFSPGDIVHEGHYWPLVYTSFWLEHKLWGFAPAGYHVVNIVLHFVNTLLLWRIVARLAHHCIGAGGAWAVAAVFAVHPLHVESVAWVIERKDLLCALFYLAAVLVWMRFIDTPQQDKTLRGRRYFTALALFVAALLSKSIAVTLPLALAILHWWRHGRVSRG